MEMKLLEEKPDSITVNEYYKEQSIAPHVDSQTSGNIISILSLITDAIMVFEKGKERHEVLLPARSLMQMRGEIREEWAHSIKPVKNNRYSIVFRKGKPVSKNY